MKQYVLTDLVKSRAVFEVYKQGNLIYSIGSFRFPVPISELDDAAVGFQEKGIFFMKWIKRQLKALQEQSE